MPSDLRYGMQLGGGDRDFGEGVEISPDALISDDARVYGSLRGTRVSIGAHTQVFDFAVIRSVAGSGDIEIGENCYIGPHTVIYSGNGVRIGDNTLLSPGVHIVASHHETASRDEVIRRQGFRPARGGVVSEGDCLIGAGSVLLEGTYIERGAIVGAGSLAAARVPAYTVWAGNPLRYLRDR